MNKVRIVFNSFNLDAVTASTLIINAFQNANSKEDPENPKYVIETVPHSPVNYKAPNMEYDFIFHVGVLMNELEIQEEASHTNNYFYVGYGKHHSNDETTFHGSELNYLLENNGHILTPTFMWNESVDDINTKDFSNLIKLTGMLLKKYFPEISNDDSQNNWIYDSITKYSLNQNIIETFKLTHSELSLVHANIDYITNAAFTGSPTNEFTPIDLTDKKNSVRTIKARSIISNGLAEHIYGNQKNSIRAQTLNCSEDYIQDLMRMVSYSHQNAVFYQDTKHSRQWWVCGKDKNLIAEMIPYQRKHYDRGFIYLVSNMPQMSNK